MPEVQPVEIENIITEALSRYSGARAKYGALDLEADGRDFLKELEEELLDTVNYAVFQIIRLRRLSVEMSFTKRKKSPVEPA